MKKNVLRYLFEGAFVMLFTQNVFAYDFEVDGIYYLASGSTATVTYASTSYNSYIQDEVDIPSTVEYDGIRYEVSAIGGFAFNNCVNMKSVKIPESVLLIDIGAFQNCTGLTNIEIPSSVTTIGDYILRGCSSLESLTLPFVGKKATATSASYNTLFGYVFGTSSYTGGVATVQSYAVRSERTYYIPSSLKEVIITGGNILDGAFYGCSNLKKVTLPKTISEIANRTFYNCTGLTGELGIPNSVESIGNEAFYNCTGLTGNLNIPNSVKSIGSNAFSNCTGLTGNLNIPNSVESIGDYAFKGCLGFSTNIIVPNSVQTIGNCAFFGCNNIESVTLPFVGSDISTSKPFGYIFCSGTSKSYFIGEYGSPTRKIVYSSLPSSLKHAIITGGNIDNDAFLDCSGLESVTLPDSLKSIGNGAFRDCSRLKQLILPNSLEEIGEYAFSGCSSLSSIVIPKSVTAMGKKILEGCTSLEDVTFPYMASNIFGLDDFSSAKLRNITISKGQIPEYAFKNCKSLVSVSIDDDVSSIGYAAFSGCENIETMSLPFAGYAIDISSYSYERSFWGYIFGSISFQNTICVKQANNVSYYIPSSLKTVFISKITNHAFHGCNNISKVITSEMYLENTHGIEGLTIIIKDGITEIATDAFGNCTNIASVTLPNTVTSIGDHAFDGCVGLKSIKLPDSVKYIGVNAFYNCHNSSTIDVPNSVESIGNSAFLECSGVKSLSLTNVKEIGSNAFCSSGLSSIELPFEMYCIEDGAFKDCVDLRNVILPKKISSMGSSVFQNCINLKTILLPENITTITAHLFNGCIMLESIIFPENLMSIETSAFSGCSSLKSMIFPENLTSIETSAFSGCSSLKSMVIPSTVVSIGEKILKDCSSLESLSIPFLGSNINDPTRIDYLFDGDGFGGVPASLVNISVNGGYLCDYAFSETKINSIVLGDVKSIGARAFMYCNNLSHINIPESVEQIGERAFDNCKSLTSFTIPNSVKEIGSKCFESCVGLTSITLPRLDQHVLGYYFGIIPKSLTTVIITNDDKIPNDAFKEMSNLSCVKYEQEVTNIGSYAFYGCYNLKDLVLPHKNVSVGNYAFYLCTRMSPFTLSLSDDMTSIGTELFYNCKGLKSIYIPRSILSIANDAFKGCDALTSIYYYGTGHDWYTSVANDVILRNVQVYCLGDKFEKGNINYFITDYQSNKVSLAGLSNVDTDSLTIPLNVENENKKYSLTSISDGAFQNCENLKVINFIGTKTQWKKITIGEHNELLNNVNIVYNYGMSDTDLSKCNNYLYMEPQKVQSGEVNVVNVNMLNDMAVTGFQFELELPDGFTLEKDENGRFKAELSEERTSSQKHNIFEVSKLKNGRILFICSSTNNNTFIGDDGPVACLNIKVDDTVAEGDYTIGLYNMALSNASSEVERVTRNEGKLHVFDCKPGDVNMDNNITIADAVGIVNFVIHANTDGLNEKAADANQDGSVSIADAVFVVNTVIHAK